MVHSLTSHGKESQFEDLTITKTSSLRGQYIAIIWELVPTSVNWMNKQRVCMYGLRKGVVIDISHFPFTWENFSFNPNSFCGDSNYKQLLELKTNSSTVQVTKGACITWTMMCGILSAWIVLRTLTRIIHYTDIDSSHPFTFL